jgi:hypothetical protein
MRQVVELVELREFDRASELRCEGHSASSEAAAQSYPEPGNIQVDRDQRFREKGLGPFAWWPLSYRPSTLAASGAFVCVVTVTAMRIRGRPSAIKSFSDSRE